LASGEEKLVLIAEYGFFFPTSANRLFPSVSAEPRWPVFPPPRTASCLIAEKSFEPTHFSDAFNFFQRPSAPVIFPSTDGFIFYPSYGKFEKQ